MILAIRFLLYLIIIKSQVIYLSDQTPPVDLWIFRNKIQKLRTGAKILSSASNENPFPILRRKLIGSQTSENTEF
ncbi:MAG: hypothetical protein A2156_06990 [Deltaproteobacteria bacterium RBG_16_48_10]|nr:MAG: hypothetical protein A2156_06990 [Deltaproteobacteria bacterium RBG_16_48_10]